MLPRQALWISCCFVYTCSDYGGNKEVWHWQYQLLFMSCICLLIEWCLSFLTSFLLISIRIYSIQFLVILLHGLWSHLTRCMYIGCWAVEMVISDVVNAGMMGTRVRLVESVVVFLYNAPVQFVMAGVRRFGRGMLNRWEQLSSWTKLHVGFWGPFPHSFPCSVSLF